MRELTDESLTDQLSRERLLDMEAWLAPCPQAGLRRARARPDRRRSVGRLRVPDRPVRRARQLRGRRPPDGSQPPPRAQRLGELQHQIDQGAESSLGFLVADIDHFKRINDEHGHPVGDAALRDVAYAKRSELRAFDLIYRLGGEEFAILLPGADLEKTKEIAERLRAAVARASSGGVSVTMSFGAGAVSGSDVRLAQLYAEADAALYRAKRAGRNRVGAAAPA